MKIGGTMSKLINRSNMKLLLLILTIIGYVPYISSYFDKFTEIVLIIIFLMSTYDLYLNRNLILKSKIGILLLTAPLFYIFTIFLNGFYFNDLKMLVYITILTSFLCLDCVNNKNPLDELENSSKIMAYFTFVMVIASLIVYFMRVTIPFSTDVFTEKYIGFYNNSLYGILGNSNVLCFFSFIGIFSSLYLFNKNKFFHSANIILQFICIVLSNSRGGYLGLLFSTTLYTFLYINAFKNSSISKSLLKTALVIIAILLSTHAIKNINTHIFVLLDNDNVISQAESIDKIEPSADNHEENTIDSNMKSDTETNTVIQTEPIIEEESITTRNPEEKQGNVNRRLDMYRAGLNCFIDNPLFGVGREQTSSILCEKYLSKDSAMNNIGLAYNMHNIYIQVLAGCGLFGFISVFGFIFVLAIKSLLAVFKKNKQKKEMMFLITLISYCAYALFANLFESELYLSRSITAVFFWLCLGYLFNYFFNGGCTNEK